MTSIKKSILFGCLIVGLSLLVILIFKLPITIETRATILILLLIFLGAFYWHFSLSHWENVTRRRTAATLHFLGSLLIIKAVPSLLLNNTNIASQFILETKDGSSLAGQIIGMFFMGSPWYADLSIAALGFFMLLAISIFAKQGRQFEQPSDIQATSNKKDENEETTIEVLSSIPNYATYDVFNTYDSDLPPLVDIWVGRSDELAALANRSNSVIAITGIGGQGKSALAAIGLNKYIADNSSCFWDWRDCKEQADKFRTQLVSVIEHYTAGEISASNLVDADVAWLSKFFFRTVEKQHGIIVFDNVDNYVDVNQKLFIKGISSFVEEALRVDHNMTIIFTCRPRISYASTRFRELYLVGLNLKETQQLFKAKLGSRLNDDINSKVSAFHKHTDGHPLWLNLIASQIDRKPETADVILQQLQCGEVDDRLKAMLRSIWKTLNKNQYSILRCMAELPRANEKETLYEYACGEIATYNKFHKAFEGLRAISLIIEKGAEHISVNRYDLHPSVRQFIKSEYQNKTEKNEYIENILKCCDQIILKLSDKKMKSLSTELLEQQMTKVELCITQDNIEKAIDSINLVTETLLLRGIHEEYIRLGKLILDKTNWKESSWLEKSEFDTLLSNLMKIMVEMGRETVARPYLNEYSNAVATGTSQFIAVCQLNTYFEWLVGNYSTAIKWGKQGVDIKKKSDLDTEYDASHNLALAQRDAGETKEALHYFSHGEDITAILNDNHLESEKSAHFYGNIGRCLFFDDKIDQAITCYVKSFALLEKDSDSTTIINRGYAAYWLGESLEKLEHLEESYDFYKLASQAWSRRAPFLAEKPQLRIEALMKLNSISEKSMTENEIYEKCKVWVDNNLKKKLENI